MTRSTLRSLGLALLLGAPVGLVGCGGHSASSSNSTAAPVSSGTAPVSSGTNNPTGPQVIVEPSALPAAAAVQQVAPDPILALAFKVAAVEDVDLVSVAIVASGTIDESTLGEAVLVHDFDGDGARGPLEPALATAPAPLSDDGGYQFQLQSPLRIAAGDTGQFLVTVDASVLTGLDQARAVGKTVALELSDATAFLVTDAAGAPAIVDGSFPASGSATLALGDHVLISEVGTGPGERATSSEFVELFNPTGQPIALDDYYLTDFTADVTTGEFYWKLPTGADFGPAGSAYSSDFVVRFPGGETIDAGEVIVVAVDGEGFKARFGTDPDYCLRNPGTTSAMQMLTWDGVAGGANFVSSPVTSQPGLTGPGSSTTGRGEFLCLFTWDGAADLIQDVDLINYGSASLTNAAVDKTPAQNAPGVANVEIDSAFDADRALSTFKPDTSEFDQYNRRAPLGASIKRVDFTEGNETKQDGNGITGHDETSEAFGDGIGGSGTFEALSDVADATPGRLE